jgi:hypothetical protein
MGREYNPTANALFSERLEKFRARFKKKKAQKKIYLAREKQRHQRRLIYLTGRSSPQKEAVAAADYYLCDQYCYDFEPGY